MELRARGSSPGQAGVNFLNTISPDCILYVVLISPLKHSLASLEEYAIEIYTAGKGTKGPLN